VCSLSESDATSETTADSCRDKTTPARSQTRPQTTAATADKEPTPARTFAAQLRSPDLGTICFNPDDSWLDLSLKRKRSLASRFLSLARLASIQHSADHSLGYE
jgi:hypothetical protein